MKKNVFLIVLSVVMLSVLSSCAQKEQGDTLILFTEQENGVEPFQTRMIITKNFLRIDDGEGTESFVLYDRTKKIVYSTSPDENRVMEIHEKKLKKGEVFEPPFKLTYSVKEMPKMKDAPTINGETAKHYQLITNDKVCYDVVAIKNLMPSAIKALTEFHAHMATDSRLTFNNMPEDMLEACEMTLTTFKPTRQFEFGFPIQEWGKREYRRSLVDYDINYKADPKLFILPKGYQYYTVQDLREGKVKFIE